MELSSTTNIKYNFAQYSMMGLGVRAVRSHSKCNKKCSY